MEIGDLEIKRIDSILSFLNSGIDTLLPPHNKEWPRINIQIISQFVGTRMGLLGKNWRDKCMADNFIWIKEHNPDSKFIIWAHNTHIMKTTLDNIDVPSYVVMGRHLAQSLDSEYTNFGFAFFDGSITAIGDRGLVSYETGQAIPGTLEYLLNLIDEPIFILDLKKIKSDNRKDTEWLLERLDYKGIGALVSDGYQGDFFVRQRKIADDFDYLIFIKTSSPSEFFSLEHNTQSIKSKTKPTDKLNLDFEELEEGMPVGWQANKNENIKFAIDSTKVISGKHSASIESLGRAIG